MNKEKVLNLLKNLRYPNFDKDIVSAGIIKYIKVLEGGVDIRIFTGHSKEDSQRIADDIKAEILKNFSNMEVSVMILHENPADNNTPILDKKVLENIKYKIAVASGKGGVGKSTVAVNLARAFARIFSKDDARVGLFDCDIHGPSTGILMDKEASISSDGKKLFPAKIEGIKTISMSMLVDESQPLIWRGPMIMSALKQFIEETEWGNLDIAIFDLPPGTGDAVISVTQLVPLDGALIVSTPNELAFKTATRGANLFTKTDIRILGIIENMSYAVLPDGKKFKVFGESHSTESAEILKTKVICEIPIDVSLQTKEPSKESEKIFDELARRILDSLSKI